MALVNQIIQAQLRFQEELLARRNVVGVAVGYKETDGEMTDELALAVLVEEKKPAAQLTADDMIPKEINGMQTDVYEVGFIEAFQSSPRSRFRPVIPPGVSMGHFKITAGTFGALVKDANTNEVLLLSNNHVFAASNDALVGDVILQPGPVDGGSRPDDVVAHLERFIRLRFVDDPPSPPPSPPSPPPSPPSPPPSPPVPPPPSPPPPPGTGTPSCDIAAVFASLGNILAKLNGSERRVQVVDAHAAASPGTATRVATAFATPENQVDCALARPVTVSMFSDEIRGIGRITGAIPASLGMRVRKSGRTTDYTEGTVTLINATVNVAYNTSIGQRTARFTGQVFTTAMSQGGDSGSLIVDANSQNAVGLLFAGSNVATIFNPIDLVLNALNIKF